MLSLDGYPGSLSWADLFFFFDSELDDGLSPVIDSNGGPKSSVASLTASKSTYAIVLPEDRPDD